MDNNHRKIEIILILISIVSTLLILTMLNQSRLLIDLGPVPFTTQMQLSVTLLITVSITGAAYAGMFYAQERFSKDLVVSIALFNLGITAFLHMITHRGSVWSDYFVLSTAKSNTLITLGYTMIGIAFLVSSGYTHYRLSRKGEFIIGLVGLLVIPLSTVYFAYQPFNAYISYYNPEMIGSFVQICLLALFTIFILGIILTCRNWKQRLTSVATGTILMLVFMIIAVLTKYLTAFFTTVITGTPLEMIGIYSAMFGILIYLISILGTSMVNPHWRE